MMKVSFELQLPKQCEDMHPVLIRQTLKYIVENELCFLLTEGDVKHCAVRKVKLTNNKQT